MKRKLIGLSLAALLMLGVVGCGSVETDTTPRHCKITVMDFNSNVIGVHEGDFISLTRYNEAYIAIEDDNGKETRYMNVTLIEEYEE